MATFYVSKGKKKYVKISVLCIRFGILLGGVFILMKKCYLLVLRICYILSARWRWRIFFILERCHLGAMPRLVYVQLRVKRLLYT